MTAYDNLSTGHREFVRWGDFVHGDILDASALQRCLHNRHIEGGIHFAAKAYVGEWHEPETHILPLAILAALRKAPPLRIDGTDYPTTDGTCICDYVHVGDLAAAHVAALKKLTQAGCSQAINLGTGLLYFRGGAYH